MSALVVGAGPGLSASFARLMARRGHAVALAARDTGKLAALAAETGARVHGCDAADPAAVSALFDAVGEPEIVLYNASARARGPLVELDPVAVRRSLEVSAFGAFLVAQQAARRMLPKQRGCILLTGASAAVKGFANSAAFAMGKFALRGLAQSMARELHPQGIHVVPRGGGRRHPRAGPHRAHTGQPPRPRRDCRHDGSTAGPAALGVDGRDRGAAVRGKILKRAVD